MDLQHNAFDLTKAQYDRISNLIYHHAGITMRTGKEELVKSRLMKRLHAVRLENFDDYISYLAGDESGSELTAMIDALTTNKTSFFRETPHFDFLTERLQRWSGSKIRIWSAGCSTGEEPYTIAITLREHLAGLDGIDAKILATDISTKVLAEARAAEYTRDKVVDISKPLLCKYFTKSNRGNHETYHVANNISGMVSFARLNLMSAWPMKGPFDFIFCRNVMIYFDNPTRQSLIDRFWNILAPGGYLFTGHSESLHGLNHSFTFVQPAVHLKA